MDDVEIIETENTDKRAYEFSFLVKTEEDVAEVTTLLSQHGAEVVMEGPVRHTPLSYPIEKQTEAFFGFVHVRLLPTEAKKLEHEANVNKTLLRSLLVLLPRTPQPAPPRPRSERPMNASPTESHGTERSSAPRAEAPVALSNEELERKIEEILA